jgi:hypothetical protein
MNNGKVPISDSYQDYLVNYLSTNPQLAIAYITETLAEKNPETQILQQAINQVYTALSTKNNLSLNNLLSEDEAEAVYKFASLLTKIGLKIEINFADDLIPIPEQEKKLLA